MAQLYVKIPRERVGVLIGLNGEVKEYIERRLPVKLDIDSVSGGIIINLKEDAVDPSLLFKAKEVVLAIGRGFSPIRAYKLLQDEYTTFVIIDLREILGRSQSDIKRIKGRIIGKKGKTRKLIEELTDSYVSIYGYTIAIIGDIEQIEITKEAISMIIKGNQHATVYKYLHRKRHELKKVRLQLWEGRPLIPEE
jgi:ribosomal RNA assembly protein